MFPSSGYFRGIDCPFFASGLCDRPNCHFRHVEETSSQVPVYVPTAQSKPSSLLGFVGIATKQLSRTTTVATPTNGAPQYIPTPISILEQLKKQKSCETSVNIQRVTLADVAQFTSNDDFSSSCNESISNAVNSQFNKSDTFNLKRKCDELESISAEPPQTKKVKLSVTDSNKCEPNKSLKTSLNTTSPKKACNNDAMVKTKNEKSLAKEKSFEKLGSSRTAEKEFQNKNIKKDVIHKDEIKKEFLQKNLNKPEIQNKSIEMKSPVKKDFRPSKKMASPPCLSSPKKSNDRELKLKKDQSSMNPLLKNNNAPMKTTKNLESLKIAESMEMEMAIFGDTVSGNSTKSGSNNARIKSPTKNKQIAKDGKYISGNSSLKQKVEAKKLTSKTPGNVKKTNDKSIMKHARSRLGESHEEISSDDYCQVNGDNDDDVLGGGDDDITSRMKECYKIFMEPPVKKKIPEESSQQHRPLKPTHEPVLREKKRVAHQPASNINNVPMKPKSSIKDHRQIMMDRIAEARKRQLEESTSNDTNRVPSKISQFSALSTKGSNRVAHVPSKEALKRPMITFGVTSSLVPVNHRQLQLNKIVDKCLEIYDVRQDAYTRSLEEEKKLMTGCPSKFVYNSRLVSLMIVLNREINNKKGDKPGCESNTSRSSRDGNFTLNRYGPMEPPPLTANEMYRRLKAYILTEDQLKENGFPFRDLETKAIMVIPHKKYSKEFSSDASRKICCRCSREFTILKNGNYLNKEECVYHWGPCWKKRVTGSIENRYNCCGGSVVDRGCEFSEFHVHEDNKYGNYTGFVNTLPCSPRVDDNYGIYALDCEMIYTVAGCELARVTVIDFNLKVVYDKLVKPDSKIVDYNTRFSGIKKEDMENVRTTLRDVQAVLLTMFNDKSVLIGHSLENDLLSLKLLHQNIVDTSVVFPHKLGFPYKRALRNLTVEVLKKSIQQNLDGHDSKEDAGACMELMIHKVKEDVLRSMRNARDQMLTSSRSIF